MLVVDFVLYVAVCCLVCVVLCVVCCSLVHVFMSCLSVRVVR